MPSAIAMRRRDATAVERLAVETAATYQLVLQAYEVGDAQRVKSLTLDLLDDLAALRAETDAAIDRAVGEARRLDLPWSAIGDALGVSRQAAQSRFNGPRVTAAGETPTRTREPRRTPRKKATT